MSKRRITIFGSTGSIGQTAIELILAQGGADRYDTYALTGFSNVKLLAKQAVALDAQIVVTGDAAQLDELRLLLEDTKIEVRAGDAALLDVAKEPVDWVLSAIVGAAGIAPSVVAAKYSSSIALANKESLVAAGSLLKSVCAVNNTTLIPVDSEHSALFQALRGEDIKTVDRMILTGSGGPFRGYTHDMLKSVTVKEARAHPNWSMGLRISIDSASLFNKAMEMIEIKELFDVSPNIIEVVIHPQSIIHSMVGFRDGSIISQMGPPDMTGAIGFALNMSRTDDLPVDRLDFAKLARLDFEDVDRELFPAISLAEEVMRMGGASGAAFNASKEVALDAFLNGEISFLCMSNIVNRTLEEMDKTSNFRQELTDLKMVMAFNEKARYVATQMVALNEV